MSKFDEPKTCTCAFNNNNVKHPCACPPDLPNGKYNEEETLAAIEKFRQFYEDKLKQMDIDGGGDCTELKLKLQERWINDLTEQTQMMARIVKELEEEATTRVKMLEDKLKQTSKAAYEEDVPETENAKINSEILLKKKKEEYEALKRSMLDMRSALTEEVACKHDLILALKKDVFQLEERCVQSDKQTAFKDDIIKELRKEIKQLKQQPSRCVPNKQLKAKGNRTILTTIRYNRNVEKAKYSTVIFIKDDRKNKEKVNKKCNKGKKGSFIETKLNKPENKFLNASYLKEIPVKEKSKFTVANSNKTFCSSNSCFDEDSSIS